MSFLKRGTEWGINPVAAWQNQPVTGRAWLDPARAVLHAPKPLTPPNVPNPNDAMNAAQSQTDAMRMRRGLLANIYAGGQASTPVTGKTQLGT